MTPDNESDLRWYFVEARGDCGVRSTFGAQLELVRQGTLPGRNERCLQETPGDLEGFCASVDRDRRRTKAGIRANRVAGRLRRLPRRAQVVLELHFGADTHLGAGGISLALACWTMSARKAYSAAKRERRARAQALGSIRLWLLWLTMQAHKDTGDAAAVLDGILAEARAALNHAQRAYEAR